MSALAEAQARERQVRRIARLLLVEPAEVTGLADVPAGDLRELHDAISESYFGPGRDLLGKVAGLAKVLPAAVAGRFAERFLPPYQGARAAEMLEPAKARDLCTKVSVRYLADLSLALDPARAAPILAAIPAQRIGEVSAELFARQEYAAVAELAGSVSRDGLRAAVAVASGHDLLMVLPLLEWTPAVSEVLSALPDTTIDAVLAAVADEQQPGIGAAVLAGLPDGLAQRVRERAAGSGLAL